MVSFAQQSLSQSNLSLFFYFSRVTFNARSFFFLFLFIINYRANLCLAIMGDIHISNKQHFQQSPVISTRGGGVCPILFQRSIARYTCRFSIRLFISRFIDRFLNTPA